MTEYELHTQGASHGLAPACDGHDPMRNRPLLNGTDTSMTINRYGLGREHTNMVGSPAIVGCADGEYVRHADHAALISELQAELAGVERFVVAQTVTIAELRVDHSGGANDMVDAPVPSDPVAWRIDYTCPRNCGSVVYHRHNAIADYRDIDPNATSTPLFEQPPTSAQPSASDGWRDEFKRQVYDNLAAADNQDVALEEYPERILLVLDSLGATPLGENLWKQAVANSGSVAHLYHTAAGMLWWLESEHNRLVAAAPTPPADGQVQQEAESWDLSHQDKSHTMTVYSPGHVEHFKALGWKLIERQDADKVDAQLSRIPDGDRLELVGALGLLTGHGYNGCAAALQRVLDADIRNRTSGNAQPDPAMAGDDLSDREIIALSRVMLAGKRTANMVAFARKLLARKRVQPAHTLGESKEDYTRVFNMGRDSVQLTSRYGNCSVCHPYNCYGCDPCKQASGEDAKPVDPKAVWMAAIDCPHVIDDNTITLRYTDKQAGHGALDQLARRVMAAMQQEAK